MKVTLLDEQGVELTEVSSHLGRSSGRLLVDWATRPDALFRYYFDRGRRTVTLVSNAVQYSAILDTRWQMGARFWFLHQFSLIRSAPPGLLAGPAQRSGLTAPGIPSLHAVSVGVAESAIAGAHALEPRRGRA